MSATLQAEVFQGFFSGLTDADDQAAVNVEGRTFPVREIFLNEVAAEDSALRRLLSSEVAAAVDEAMRFFGGTSDAETESEEGMDEDERGQSSQKAQDIGAEFRKRPSLLPGLGHAALALVPALAMRDSTMLVFLPGIAELGDLANLFASLKHPPEDVGGDAPSSYRIFVMHSLVSRQDQEAVFKAPTGGVCHVVLASNIAESSLTLPNVTAVIDFGLHREVVHDPIQRLSKLVTAWCSKASARQRAGRAGRTRPGVALRLFPKGFFEEEMSEYDTPEMLRTSLSKTFLRTKRLSHVLQTAARRHGDKFPVDVQDVRALLGCLPQPPELGALRAAVSELSAAGALAAEDERASITSLGIFAEGLPVDLPLCRLLWLGALWGCAPEATVLAAACASSDPFTCPTRMYVADTEAYVRKLRESFHSRQHFDGGHYSEPLMLLRLFCYWVERYASAGADKGSSVRRNGWKASCRLMAEVVAVQPQKMQQFIARVDELAERQLQLQLPGRPQAVAASRQDLQSLRKLLLGSRRGGGQNKALPEVFRADASMLRMLLVAAFSEQVLVGRRYMDTLRGPPRPKSLMSITPGGGALPVPGEGEESNEEGSGPVVEGEGEEDEQDDEEDEDEDEEYEDDDGEDEGAERDDAQGEAGVGEGWFETRKAMLDAVNSLPVVRSHKWWRRVVVARLSAGNPEAAPRGALPFKRVAGVMEKISGTTPRHVSRKNRGAKYAAIAFPAEQPLKPAKIRTLPAPATPVLKGTSTEASLCRMFSVGRDVFDVDGEVLSRPTSPYLITFYLPERQTELEENKQKMIRGLLDARNPVGFTCHVSGNEDFICTASALQLQESGTTVRAEGATVLPADHVLFALTTLSPTRSSLSFRKRRMNQTPADLLMMDAVASALQRNVHQDDDPEDEDFVTAVRLSGWEVSMATTSMPGLPEKPLLEALNEVRQGVREALRVGDLHDEDEDSAKLAGDRRQKKRRRKKRRLRPLPLGSSHPDVAARKLVDLVERARDVAFQLDVGSGPPEAKKAIRSNAKWLDATLDGEGTGHMDYLLPIRIATSGEGRRRRGPDEAVPTFIYRCPECGETFKRRTRCKRHLQATDHRKPSSQNSWASILDACRVPESSVEELGQFSDLPGKAFKFSLGEVHGVP